MSSWFHMFTMLMTNCCVLASIWRHHVHDFCDIYHYHEHHHCQLIGEYITWFDYIIRYLLPVFQTIRFYSKQQSIELSNTVHHNHDDIVWQVGLAVDDIKEVQDNAKLESLAMQVTTEYFYSFQNFNIRFANLLI